MIVLVLPGVHFKGHEQGVRNNIFVIYLLSLIKLLSYENSELHFLSRLSAYTLKSVIIRVSLVSGVGLLFLFLAIKFAGDKSIRVTGLEYMQVVLIFNIISESNVLIDHLAERFFPIPEKLSLRVVVHVFVSLICNWCCLFFAYR